MQCGTDGPARVDPCALGQRVSACGSKWCMVSVYVGNRLLPLPVPKASGTAKKLWNKWSHIKCLHQCGHLALSLRMTPQSGSALRSTLSSLLVSSLVVALHVGNAVPTAEEDEDSDRCLAARCVPGGTLSAHVRLVCPRPLCR